MCPTFQSGSRQGRQGGAALQRGQESGSVRTFVPVLDAPGQRPLESSRANVACYGTSYRRKVKACGAKWPVFLVGMTGLNGGLWTQKSPASESGSVLAVGA